MVDLLKVYGDCWGGEAGEWNTSLQNKYLEYMFACFLEENFIIHNDFDILNIGIGAGIRKDKGYHCQSYFAD